MKELVRVSPTMLEGVSKNIGLFVGVVFLLVSVLPGPIMRGKSNEPHKNQTLARVVCAILGLMILLLWYSDH
jgi:hypothetical protein